MQSDPAPELDSDEFDDVATSAQEGLTAQAAHLTQEHRFVMEAAQHGERLDLALAQLLPDSSRSFLRQLVESGDVRVDAKLATKPAMKLRIGQVVLVRQRPLPQESAFCADPEVAQSLQVVFEDAYLLIINKAPGLVVHPAAGNWSGTLLNGLLARDECHALLPRAGIVHRLDKDTSGLMVVARTREAMDALIRMIAQRQVKRQYLAMAHYAWRGESVRQVNRPIGRDPRNRQRMAVVDLAQYPGKEAVTDFELIANSHDWAEPCAKAVEQARAQERDAMSLAADAYCLLRCNLHTGRTHQIRVHAAFLHHPLIADVLYGGRPVGTLRRQGLHAQRLAFTHPMTGQALAFEAGLPQDMRRACEELALRYNAGN